MDTGAIVLAAGESQISNIPMLKLELDSLRKIGISPVVVVTGHDRDNIMRELSHRKVIFVHNENYATAPMISSIKLGLSKIKNKCIKAVLIPADMPLFKTATITKLIDQQGEIVIPSFHGKTGHPICIDTSCADRIISCEDSFSLKSIIESKIITCKTSEVDDPGILFEIEDTDSYLASIKNRKNILHAMPVSVDLTVNLKRTGIFFNEELNALLKKIDDCCSMNKACKEMNISYSRAWKMINNAEEQLDIKLIERKTGGINGGGSGLTVAGRKFVDSYDKTLDAINKYARKCYEKYF